MSTNQNDSKHTLRKLAYIFMIISTVLLAFLLIPMTWTIPMTLAAKRKMNNLEEETITLGVCALLFMAGLIPGILLLVSNK